MSIQSEINRIKTDKESLITNLKEKGVQIADGATLGDISLNVKEMEIGIDTSDATATANDILSGKTAYVNGTKVTGNINTVIQATPSITVNSNGLITAKATQSAGYVNAGSKNGTKQLTTQAAKTIIPSTSNQTAVASGRYTTGTITVKGDSNLKAENIAEGISIFGVTGTHSGGGGSSGGGGFKVTFPATATNWNKVFQARLVLYDGTFVDMADYSVIAGQTVNGVIGIQCAVDYNYTFYVLKMTIKNGAIAWHNDAPIPSTIIQVAQAGESTPTPYGGARGAFWWPIADTVISAIEMYNTD